MKAKLTSCCVAILMTGAVWLKADEAAKPKQTSAEFERMKSLVGTWKGKADMGQGPMDMVLQYRLVGGGSVLEERILPGTPHEMVTMYYDKGGKLALTHYCVMGNRPQMLLKSADAKTLTFDFDESCGINPSKESHMHGMTIRFDDADTITMSCKAFMDGKPAEEHPATLKRVSS